ncbi:Crp/Fnr family transcriptional regulator [Zhouia amylolytica]|uniref:cAMP-binding protein n=1 Tax=Zhouia amylolytica AD3 TaxID=1286632 RepID=W2UJY6_9FLAO|nr:Crp/Fnr family transcriptional regulator [Zhouia amylolytica]ETN94485.1 cAMP-binding protein [Zhouia amylolytica AD3]
MIRKNPKLLQYLTETLIQEIPVDIVGNTYKAGAVILDQNKRVSNVYIIKQGVTKCYLTEDNGTQFIQEFFGEGELFGEVETLKGGLSFCCIEAINPVEIIQIPAKVFMTLLDTDKKFNRLILEALTNKIQYKAIRHAYNQSHTIEDKIQRLEKDFPELFQKLAKQDIANYLGITPRSLNRVLNKTKL